ncbi:uncharacterized protein RHOBADRAFT_22437 [Rhodotorula graminis WP1]|uniref:Metallo-beta-lactamase domain-containing protein n=1 Tax=Rhodotorula graminis (strain WP1) TaxID=578459 RepID=A0A0P9FCM9_RHOGW|nr:uncharacterized protein RHOBADRAFT_22437 [Rhodotorula graminis WP1]KPV73456.1 hypothetical protein RHOBADRAFT_22437 [Rhodotorula graminis WP1]
MFSARASPVTWFGPKRMREAPCLVEDLPGVDLVLISHNHYDHLDLATILAVHARWPRAMYCVGLGNAPWFIARGISPDQVREMDWWEEVVFPASQFLDRPTSGRRRAPRAEGAAEEIWVTCVPAQHTSGRSLLDQRKTLWCGWVVERLARAKVATLPASFPPATSPSSSFPTSRTSFRASSSIATSSDTLLDPFDDSHGVDYAAWARRAVEGGLPAARARAEETMATARWVRRGSVYHAGDTGCRPCAGSPLTSPVFSALGAEYGPFDLSFIPIWRGGTLGFISALGLRLCQENLPTSTHASPTDAVQIHLDVRSRNTVGIHFGTFQGSHLEALEALHELESACDEAGVRNLRDEKGGKRGRMGRVDIGETIVVPVRAQIIDV